MKKIIMIIIYLLIGVMILTIGGETVSGETVEMIRIELHTQPEDREQRVSGVESIRFNIYDLTNWRHERPTLNREQLADDLLTKYSKRADLQKFLQAEKMPKINPTELVPDEQGVVYYDLLKEQNQQAATYLVVAGGETGKDIFAPVLIVLPYIDDFTGVEADHLFVEAKYYQEDQPIPIDEPEPAPDPDDPTPIRKEPIMPDTVNGKTTPKVRQTTIAKPFGSSTKNYPQTNELIKNYVPIGLMFIVAGFIGCLKLQKTKK